MTSVCAGAAVAAATASDRRRFSCEVHRCANDDDDNNTTMTLRADDTLRHSSLTSSSPGAVPRCRRHRDNSVVLVEVVCDCAGRRQHRPTTKTQGRYRPRSASESPTNRCRAAGSSGTGPASDSEITVKQAQARERCDCSAPVLQVFANIFCSPQQKSTQYTRIKPRTKTQV